MGALFNQTEDQTVQSLLLVWSRCFRSHWTGVKWTVPVTESLNPNIEEENDPQITS
jgi:hypothetical protein